MESCETKDISLLIVAPIRRAILFCLANHWESSLAPIAIYFAQSQLKEVPSIIETFVVLLVTRAKFKAAYVKNNQRRKIDSTKPVKWSFNWYLSDGRPMHHFFSSRLLLSTLIGKWSWRSITMSSPGSQGSPSPMTSITLGMKQSCDLEDKSSAANRSNYRQMVSSPYKYLKVMLLLLSAG